MPGALGLLPVTALRAQDFCPVRWDLLPVTALSSAGLFWKVTGCYYPFVLKLLAVSLITVGKWVPNALDLLRISK